MIRVPAEAVRNIKSAVESKDLRLSLPEDGRDDKIMQKKEYTVFREEMRVK